MPITKDTPKYAAILLAADGSTELIFAADDKRRAVSEGLAEYVAEKEDTESQVGQPDYVEPAWDLYVRERDVDKLVAAAKALRCAWQGPDVLIDSEVETLIKVLEEF